MAPGRSTKRASALGAALALALVASAGAAHAEAPSPDPDPWFGRDKALHFAGSFALASGGYALGLLAHDRPWTGLVFGGGLSLSLGAAKEGLDAAGLGTASWKDFAWDAIGAALGLGVTATFDLALRGTHR